MLIITSMITIKQFFPFRLKDSIVRCWRTPVKPPGITATSVFMERTLVLTDSVRCALNHTLSSQS